MSCSQILVILHSIWFVSDPGYFYACCVTSFCLVIIAINIWGFSILRRWGEQSRNEEQLDDQILLMQYQDPEQKKRDD